MAEPLCYCRPEFPHHAEYPHLLCPQCPPPAEQSDLTEAQIDEQGEGETGKTPPMELVDERRDTALHEAAHAVAAYWQRVAIQRVTIQPDDDLLGSCAHGRVVRQDIEWDISDRNRIRAERYAMIALTGPAATRHFLTLTSRLEAYDHSQHSSDYLAAINVLGYFSDADILEAHLHYMEARARAFVASEWWLIEAVADALIARTTLTGRDAKRFIAEAINRRFAPALDAYTARLEKDQTEEVIDP